MSIKHWVQVGGAVACLSLGGLADAAPWLEPGNARARFSMQKLADRGHLERVTTAWPLSWAAVESGLSDSVSQDLNAVGMPVAYLSFEKEQLLRPSVRGEFGVFAQTEEPGLSGFEDVQSGDGGASLTLQLQGYSLAAGLTVSQVAAPHDDDELQFDGSYLAAKLGNWELGAGAIDRWWGPGWQSSLILSNNARAIPAVWLNRADTRAPEIGILRWLGPWGLTVMAGSTERVRAVPEAKLLGMRVTVSPIDGLNVALSRMIMFGGRGRPESASVIWDALTGRDNSQDGSENDPGNQVGAVDARYGFAVGQQAAGVYMQMMGEDEAGAFPARKSWLFGVDWTSQLLGGDQQWFLEYANTLADDMFGDPRPNVSYEHFRYKTGYRHYGRNIASSLDGDAVSATWGAYHFLKSGSNVSIRLTYANINQDGLSRVVVPDDSVFYTVPASSQHVGMAQIGYEREFVGGWLEVALQALDKKVRYVSGEKDATGLKISWTSRF